MPVKGTKALQAVKGSTTVTTYTTGLPVAPVAGTLAVYVDLAAADQHRKVEVINRLRDLTNRARENEYGGKTATTLYYRMPLEGGKDSIVATTTSTEIVEGDVAIGIAASVRAGEFGSVLLDSCFQQIVDFMNEADRLTV